MDVVAHVRVPLTLTSDKEVILVFQQALLDLTSALIALRFPRDP